MLVKEIMTEKPDYLSPTASLKEAADIMRENQIRRLIVLNNDKEIVGVISLGDIANKSNDTQLSGEIIEDVSEPTNILI